MAVLAPHFDLPFRFGAVAEQGTGRDLANCVFATVVCPLGWRDEVPDFGLPHLAFDTIPVMKEPVKAAILIQEPRARILFSEGEGVDQYERLVKIAVESRV